MKKAYYKALCIESNNSDLFKIGTVYAGIKKTGNDWMHIITVDINGVVMDCLCQCFSGKSGFPDGTDSIDTIETISDDYFAKFIKI